MAALFEDAAGHNSLSIQLMYDEYDELFGHTKLRWSGASPLSSARSSGSAPAQL